MKLSVVSALPPLSVIFFSSTSAFIGWPWYGCSGLASAAGEAPGAVAAATLGAAAGVGVEVGATGTAPFEPGSPAARVNDVGASCGFAVMSFRFSLPVLFRIIRK